MSMQEYVFPTVQINKAIKPFSFSVRKEAILYSILSLIGHIGKKKVSLGCLRQCGGIWYNKGFLSRGSEVIQGLLGRLM